MDFENTSKVEELIEEPPKTEKISKNDHKPYIIMEDFIDDSTSDQLIELIEKNKQPSTITTSEADFRTSSSAFFDPSLPIIKSLTIKLQNMMKTNHVLEGIQGILYEPQQFFKPHTDCFEQNEIKTNCTTMGQRVYSFILFLNDVTSDGELHFNHINESVEPKKNRLVYFHSSSLNETLSPKSNMYQIISWLREPISS